MEVRFLDAGAGIQQLAALADRLQGQSDRLGSLSGGDDSGDHVLHSAVDLIRQQLGAAEECHVVNVELIGRLRRHSNQLRRLQGFEHALSRILTPLQITGTLFRVHSARLSGEEEVFFAALTKDIVNLQSQALDGFGAQFAALLGVHQALDAALPRLEDQVAHHARHLANTKARLHDSLLTFQDQLRQFQDRRNLLRQLGKQVRDATIPAVIGLQYQDITRQKWEHVAAALHDIETHADILATNPKRPPTDSALFLRDVSQLQVRHLQAIEADLDHAQSDIGQGIRTMIQHLKAMDAECQQVHGNTAQAEGAVQNISEVLLGTLAEARSWMADITGMARTTSEAVGTLDRTASDLALSLRRLAIGINIIAINAQVQAAHVTAHSGLEVLSGATCASADEIRRFSDHEGASFDALSHELDGIIRECHDLTARAHAGEERFEREGRGLEERVRSTNTQTVAGLREVTAFLRELHTEATAALNATDFHDSFQDGFGQLRATLAECSAWAADHLGSRPDSATTAAAVTHLRQNYTMESERALHDAALTLKGPCAPPTPTPNAAPSNAPDTPSTPDLSPRTPAPAPVAAQIPSSLGDNVDLF